MAPKPKVFVTRIIPEVGLSLIREACDAEIWPDPLPPPADVLPPKLADIDGLVSLLTDKLDADRARSGPAPESRQQLRGRLQQHRRAGLHRARHRRRQHAGRPDRCDRGHGVLPAHRRRPPRGRGASIFAVRPMEDVGAARPSRPGLGGTHARHRRHGPHRLRPGQALPRRLGHEDPLSRRLQERESRGRSRRPARSICRRSCANPISSRCTPISTTRRAA